MRRNLLIVLCAVVGGAGLYASTSIATPQVPQCEDGIDNDHNGFIDYAGHDPGCTSFDDPTEGKVIDGGLDGALRDGGLRDGSIKDQGGGTIDGGRDAFQSGNFDAAIGIHSVDGGAVGSTGPVGSGIETPGDSHGCSMTPGSAASSTGSVALLCLMALGSLVRRRRAA